MDDTKTTNQSDNSGQARTPQPVQPQQAIPVGGTKEAPVIPSQEWVAPSTPEVVLLKEVQDAGVKAQPVMPQISESDRAQGVQMGHQNLPAPHVTAETLGMQTPRSVLNALKAAHKSWKDAMSWLVRMVIKEQDKKGLE